MNGMLSNCCSAKIDAKSADGGTKIGRCASCKRVVCRQDLRTGRIERYDLDPAPPQIQPAALAAAG